MSEELKNGWLKNNFCRNYFAFLLTTNIFVKSV